MANKIISAGAWIQVRLEEENGDNVTVQFPKEGFVVIANYGGTLGDIALFPYGESDTPFWVGSYSLFDQPSASDATELADKVTSLLATEIDDEFLLALLTTSGTNNYTINETFPTITVLTERMVLRASIANANTGDVTLDFNSLGAFHVRLADGSVPDLDAGAVYEFMWVTDHWQVLGAIPRTSNLIQYYLHDDASDVLSNKKLLLEPESPKTSVTVAGLTDGQVIQRWVTDPDNPGVNFLPAGQFRLHINASVDNVGAKTLQIKAEVREVDAGGNDIGLIGTTGTSPNLAASESTYNLTFTSGSTHMQASTTSRIQCIVKAVVTGVGVDPDGTLYYGGAADSYLIIPGSGNGGGGVTQANVLKLISLRA